MFRTTESIFDICELIQSFKSAEAMHLRMKNFHHPYLHALLVQTGKTQVWSSLCQTPAHSTSEILCTCTSQHYIWWVRHLDEQRVEM